MSTATKTVKISTENFNDIRAQLGIPETHAITLSKFCQHYGLRNRKAYDSVFIHNTGEKGFELEVCIEEYSGNLEKTLQWDKDFLDKLHAFLDSILDYENSVAVIWYSGFEHHMYHYIGF